MDKISNTSKAVIVAVVVFVLILAIFLYGGRKQNQAGVPSLNTTTSGNSVTNTANEIPTTTNTFTGGAPATGSGSKTPRPPTPPPPAPIVIRLITPVVNDVWKIGTSNPVAWDNAANFSGEIDLLDGSGNFVGVILSETGTNQTSYSWDTREYYLARYSPLKKEVVPGTYRVRLAFDGNNLRPVTGPVITITN